MKKWIFYLCCLMAVIGGGAGCSEDEYNGPLYFNEMPNEEILFELKDEPGFVRAIIDGYAFISCSEYVDEFLAYPDDGYIPAEAHQYDFDSVRYPADTTIVPDREHLYFIYDEILKEEICVFIDDFKKYDIPIGAKVYVTASVTNNVIIESDGDKKYKAYLRDLRVREKWISE